MEHLYLSGGHDSRGKDAGVGEGGGIGYDGRRGKEWEDGAVPVGLSLLVKIGNESRILWTHELLAREGGYL